MHQEVNWGEEYHPMLMIPCYHPDFAPPALRWDWRCASPARPTGKSWVTNKAWGGGLILGWIATRQEIDRDRGKRISPNADDTSLPPQFCPTCVAAGLTLRLTRTAWRQKYGSQRSMRWGAVWGCQQLPLIWPAMADRTSGVVDRQKKGVPLFWKKIEGLPVVRLWGCGTCKQGIIVRRYWCRNQYVRSPEKVLMYSGLRLYRRGLRL